MIAKTDSDLQKYGADTTGLYGAQIASLAKERATVVAMLDLCQQNVATLRRQVQ